ncbi:MAG: hypothetical protein NC484_03350, partial [Alloprevotella sp.]|nr:hypothetical protein [Alloprevotella sp.]
GKFSGLKIINHDVAGIDVGATLMQVCIPSYRAENNNRAFGTCAKDLRAISAWLKECRVTKVIMESTGIYWMQLSGFSNRTDLMYILSMRLMPRI